MIMKFSQSHEMSVCVSVEVDELQTGSTGLAITAIISLFLSVRRALKAKQLKTESKARYYIYDA